MDGNVSLQSSVSESVAEVSSPVSEDDLPVLEDGSPVPEDGSPLLEDGSPVLEDGSPISVLVGHRPDPVSVGRRTPVRRMVRRSNKLVDALSAPRITLYNVRSAWSKLRNLSDDMDMRDTDLCFLTEVWEKAENKKHRDAIEEMLEMKGIKYVSTPRPGARRGGGTALACSEERFLLTKLNIAIPSPLEACFALLKPKNPTGKIRKFICCSFYSPPRSPCRNKLAEFLVATVGRLRGEHPGCRVIMAGDRNDLKVETITSLDPTFKQLVKGFTNKNGDKILDVILTDSHDLMQEPSILPPLQVDDDKDGHDADHKGVQCLPRTSLAPQGGAVREKIMIQRFPDSKIEDFGLKLVEETWEQLEDSMDSTEMVSFFQAYSKEMVDKTFPMKEVQVGPDDKPYFTEELRQLKRRRQRAYTNLGRRSAKYINLRNRFDEKLKQEGIKYKLKIENEVKQGKRGSGYKAIRKLGNRPGDSWHRTEVTLPGYVEQKYTPLQAANKLADHFSAISNTVEPLDISKFHPALKEKLEEGRTCAKPILSQHQVYRKIMQVNKPNSSVPGDVPRPLLAKYPYMYAGPATKIFNKIIHTGQWPRQWVREESIVLSKLEKSKLPASEEDLRSISKTVWFSKCFENILGDFILPIIDGFIDPGQCGGLKKSSVSHYLVRLLDFVHSTLDKRTPHSAVLCTEDLSKAYNRGSHNLVVEDLHNMHVPGWILVIVCSYLTGRSMVLSYKKARSSERSLPGGFGAGTWLGGLLFIVKFNGACMRPPIPRPMSGNRSMQVKYIDDSSQAASINLQESLEEDPTPRPRPLNYHERTQMRLKCDENVLQQQLHVFEDFSLKNKLVINSSKCFIMLFTRSRKHAFPPEFSLAGKPVLEVKSTHRILGILVQDNLKWEAQTQEMVRRATKTIWAIRRMRALGVDQQTLVEYWKSEGRNHLEQNCAVWSSGLTSAQSQALSRAQRVAMAAIAGRWEPSHSRQLQDLQLEQLKPRREKLCRIFAKRTALESRHMDIFARTGAQQRTGKQTRLYREPKARTAAYYNSAVPYLTRLLNGTV